MKLNLGRRKTSPNFILAATGKFHSALATNNAIFTTGRNLGQIGHKKEIFHLDQFRRISAIDESCGKIRKLISSSAALGSFSLRSFKSEKHNTRRLFDTLKCF